MSEMAAHHPLDDSRAKVRWAERHLAALDDDFASWVEEAKRDRLVVVIGKRPGPAAGDLHWVVEEVADTDAFRWGLFVGDLVHNLRSAVDHVAFALADRDSPNRGEDRATQFVIARDASEFNNSRWHLKHLSRAHQDMVEREQPYQPPNSPDSHPLGLLERLSNVDKHRVVHVVQVATDFFSWMYTGASYQLFNAEVTDHVIYENPLEVGARVMSVHLDKVDPNGREPDMELDHDSVIPYLAFGPGLMLKHVIPNLIGAVRRVVEGFDSEFV